jgi:hypothetical protein
MKKRVLVLTLVLIIGVSYCIDTSYAQEMSREEIIEELNLLKERIGKLERALKIVDKKEPVGENISEDDEALHVGERELRDGWEALEEDIEGVGLGRLGKIENAEDKGDRDEILRGGERGLRDRWEALERAIDGIDLSGAVEIEAFYEHSEPKEGRKDDTSDLVLETAELAVDAEITDQLRTHILFDFEEGEGVDVDEAIVHFRAEEVCVPDLACNSPWYASAGKMTAPFGYYETHFINDSLTQVLGESKETALVVGGHRSFFNLAAGVFNGDVDETGSEDHIENFVGMGLFTLPEDVIPELRVMGGVSYTSSIADSDELTDFVEDEFGSDTIEDYVAGASAFASISFNERYFLEAEWVSALGTFKEDRNFKPEAWNLEFAVRPTEVLEIALRYGGSDDSLDFLPETQWGLVAVYELFENTSIGIEYLFNEYENDDEVTTVTTQLAVEFD